MSKGRRYPDSELWRRSWRVLPRLRLELQRDVHHYVRGDRRFVWRVFLIYDTKAPT